MSVLIKGAKLPSGCRWCYFSEDSKCALIVGCDFDDTNGRQRRKDCPLIELPDHGDLIDESETVEAQYYDDEHEEWSIKTKTVGDVLAEICEVPPKVVIPAERSVSPCDGCDERSDAGCCWCKRFERSEDERSN